MPEFAPSGWYIDIHMPITKQIADDTAVPPQRTMAKRPTESPGIPSRAQLVAVTEYVRYIRSSFNLSRSLPLSTSSLLICFVVSIVSISIPKSFGVRLRLICKTAPKDGSEQQ